MSLRTREERSVSEMRMASIFTSYLGHLMRIQENGVDGFGYPLTEPNELFPSFDHFCAEQIPGITIERYIERICTYMRCSSEAYIFALAYIRRLLYAGFPLHAKSVHRVVLTAIVIAAKTRDDYSYSMKFYAQMGGVTNVDLNTMELRFLCDLIDFRAEVAPEEYKAVMQSIAATTAINAAVALHHARRKVLVNKSEEESSSSLTSSSLSSSSETEAATETLHLSREPQPELAKFAKANATPVKSYSVLSPRADNCEKSHLLGANARLYNSFPITVKCNTFNEQITNERAMTAAVTESEVNKSVNEQLISSSEFDNSNCGMSGHSSPVDDFQQVHHSFSNEDTPSWTIACDVYWGRE